MRNVGETGAMTQLIEKVTQEKGVLVMQYKVISNIYEEHILSVIRHWYSISMNIKDRSKQIACMA